jgi:SAM-dependent methyltransferase
MNRRVEDEARWRDSGGSSAEPIYRMVVRALQAEPRGGTLVDVGCGRGALRELVRTIFDRYVGVDAVRHAGVPDDLEIHLADLDGDVLPLPDGCASAAVAVETIEHLDNPRALMRELARLTRAGGLVVVTTPNQLSLSSKMSLLVRNEFPAFRGSAYPAHRSALLEIDLRRMAAENGLRDVAIAYTGSGRIPATARHYPSFFGRLWPRAFSDNLMLVARKADGQ